MTKIWKDVFPPDPRPRWLIDLEYAAFFSPLVSMAEYEEAEAAWENGETDDRTKERTGNRGKWIADKRRFQLYTRDTYVCQYCCADCRPRVPKQITLDHVMSREAWASKFGQRRGVHDNNNLVTCCPACNSTKKEVSLRDFARIMSMLGYNTDNLYQRIRNALRRKLPPVILHETEVEPLPSLLPLIPWMTAEERRDIYLDYMGRSYWYGTGYHDA